jgi:outer membrane receptor protein involved in Fe transport
MKFSAATIASITALAAALLAAPALAQTAEDTANQPDGASSGEIVVSALRRDQTLLDAPLAITGSIRRRSRMPGSSVRPISSASRPMSRWWKPRTRATPSW